MTSDDVLVEYGFVSPPKEKRFRRTRRMTQYTCTGWWFEMRQWHVRHHKSCKLQRMIENYLRPCIKCGGQTMKHDICSQCRQKYQHKPGGETLTRSKVNELAKIEQEMTQEQAQCLYDDAMERIRKDDKDAVAWHDKRRAVARLLRENAEPRLT